MRLPGLPPASASRRVIVVVDEGGHMLAMLRMDGSRLLSTQSATAKAATAANSGVPTGGLSPEMEQRLGAATQGRITNLKGGYPIIVDGVVVGGIGVGTGSPGAGRDRGDRGPGGAGAESLGFVGKHLAG